MNRKEWPAWKEWIWRWQFLLAGIFVSLWIAFFIMQISSITKQYLVPVDEAAAVVTGQVVSVETDDWVAFLGSGDSVLYWPYKYTVEFEYNEDYCRIETPYWDWQEAITYRDEFFFGHSVQVVVDEGCEARVASRSLAIRWIGNRALYSVALFSLVVFLLFQEKNRKKYE